MCEIPSGIIMLIWYYLRQLRPNHITTLLLYHTHTLELVTKHIGRRRA